MIYQSLADLVGNTPIVKINSLVNPLTEAEVYLKLEYFNAAGSIKDRIAKAMILDAEKSGRLKPGGIIIEASSGNTAIALAMLSAIKGYRFYAVCDRFLPIAKRNKLFSYGANIVFLPETEEGVDTVEERIYIADRLAAATPGAVTFGQFNNLINQKVHYETTGPEIFQAFGHHLTACVSSAGTCGTLSGVGKLLKEKSPSTKVYGVEPQGSSLFSEPVALSYVQGAGLTFIPANLDRRYVDVGCKITDREAFFAAEQLATKEGIMVGGTGGLVVAQCLKLAKEFGFGNKILGIIPDSGDRYMETVYNHSWLFSKKLRDAKPLSVSLACSSLLNAVQRESCSIDVY